MSEPIRVLHFADVHVGMENYGKTDAESGLSSRVVDFLHRMDEMVAFARENTVDLTIFAGDAFKTRSPNPTFQREFAWRVRDLAEISQVVLLVGNHDLSPSALKASSIEIYETLDVPNVLVAQNYETMRLRTPRGDVIVGTAPYPIRARLMQNIDTMGRSIREIDQLLETVLTDTLTSLAEEADAKAGQESIPRILTGHFTVRGAVLGSERQVMLGRDIQVGLNLLADTRWDYVALGHIHKHQNLTHNREDAPPVVYSGSIERIDFGEEHDPKGFCWVQLAREGTTWDFIPVSARPMRTIRVPCRESSNPTRTVLDHIKQYDLKGAVVRLVIDLIPETDAQLNDNAIREALRQKDVFHVAGIKREIHQSNRSRLAHNPEGMTHEELLEQYFVTRNVDEERRSYLLEAARALMQRES